MYTGGRLSVPPGQDTGGILSIWNCKKEESRTLDPFESRIVDFISLPTSPFESGTYISQLCYMLQVNSATSNSILGIELLWSYNVVSEDGQHLV